MAIDIEAPGGEATELQRALQGLVVPSGAAFPGSPVTGDVFRRTDIDDIEFRYDGTRWKSRQMLSISSGVFIAAGATGSYQVPVPYFGHAGISGVWLERFEASMFRNGAGEWDFALGWVNAAGAVTVLSTLDGAGDTSANWYTKGADLGAQLDALARAIVFTPTEVSGTSSFTGAGLLHYRLIGA